MIKEHASTVCRVCTPAPRPQVYTVVCTLYAHNACPGRAALQVWEAEKQDFEDLADAEAHPSDPRAPHISHMEASKILRVNALRHFWPRLVATCGAWMANDFA